MCYNVRQIRQQQKQVLCRPVYNPIDKAAYPTPSPPLSHTQAVNLRDQLFQSYLYGISCHLFSANN